MKVVDITVDLETCSLSSNAAVMQLGAVAWDRAAEENPFLDYNINLGFDIKDQLMKGCEVDPDTMKWWSNNSEDAKKAVLSAATYDTKEALEIFCEWLYSVMEKVEADELYLWCQGTDFDISILRSLMRKFGIEMPVKHSNFRDARTYTLEIGKAKIPAAETDKDVYKYIPSLPEMCQVTVHDAVYDAMRSSWNVWYLMNLQS